MCINWCKALSPVMLLFTLGLVSCFEDKYDLKKDIDMTVTVGGEKMVVPLGNTEEITLDKIIDETETFRLEDGIYSFKKKDAIDDVKIDVEAVDISIDEPNIDPIKVEFGESTKIDPFEVDLNDTVFSVKVDEINVNQKELPKIELGIDYAVPGIVPGVTVTDFKISPEPVRQNIAVTLNASTFKDISEVREVCFGGKTGKQIVNLNINAAGVSALFEKGSNQIVRNLTVNFPKNFVLSVPDANKGYMSVENGNVLKMNNMPLDANANCNTYFYVDKFVHTFSENNLTYNGEVTFSMVYEVDGTFVNDPDAKGNLEASLYVGDKQKTEPFQLDKALVVTKDVDVDIENGSFDLEADVSGLEDLSEVKNITFKENTVVELQLRQIDLPFEFRETSRMIVEIPKVLEVEPRVLPAGVSYDAQDQRLIISGPVLKKNSTTIQMTLKGIDFAKEGKSKVENGMLKVHETLLYYAESIVNGQPVRDKLVTKGGDILYTDKLLGQKFDVPILTNCGTAGAGKNMLEVYNALVVANAVSSDVDTSADFEVHEEDMPDEVKSLQKVYLENGKTAKFLLKVDFREMPTDIKKGILMAPLTVNLPQFIVLDREKFNANKAEAYIDENNVMTLNETFQPNAGNQYTYTKEVEVIGLDFTKIPEYAVNGLPIGEDHILTIPKKYSEVAVVGKVKTAAGEEVNSKNFEDFTIYPTVEVEDMTIGKVIGKVAPKIDPVEELVDLDLDEDLDFLKDENNELHIKNPLINVTLKNTVGVPVTLDLEISGHKYGNTQPIEGSTVRVSTKERPEFMLYPAIGKDTVTTHVLISREPVKLAKGDEYNKYVNVALPNLSDLLVHLPDQVKFNLIAEADQNVPSHEVDITPNYSENGVDKARFLIKGDYDVTVPLVFEELNINYTDTIDNLNEDLWDFLDVAISTEVDVKANLINKLPADLNLTAVAADMMGRELKSIHVDVFVDGVKDGIIPGVAAEGDTVTVPIKIELRAKEAEELKKLDQLRLNVGAVISQTKNGVPLKAVQSVQFVDVKAYVKKVNLDLN